MDNPNISRQRLDELAIEGTVEGIIAEQMPGAEGKSRDQLIAIVRRVHNETVRKVMARNLAPTEAYSHEWKRIVEELRRDGM